MLTVFLVYIILGILTATLTGSFLKAMILNVYVVFVLPLGAEAQTYYTFHYKTADQLKISMPGKDYFEARTKAGKQCFKLLTGGVYPGELEGLNIIDLCSNPVNK